MAIKPRRVHLTEHNFFGTWTWRNGFIYSSIRRVNAQKLEATQWNYYFFHAHWKCHSVLYVGEKWKMCELSVLETWHFCCPKDNVKWSLTWIFAFCLRPPTDSLFSKVTRLLWSVSPLILGGSLRLIDPCFGLGHGESPLPCCIGASLC